MEFLLSVLVPDSFYDSVATVVIFTFYVFLFLIGVSERFLSLYGVCFSGGRSKRRRRAIPARDTFGLLYVAFVGAGLCGYVKNDVTGGMIRKDFNVI
ncbi:hypothetical protein K1940_002337 [Salmonella enterica subsp. enterica serovar Larochelle]|nr:hypothetical protein [Salmonella enterica subsp. enterica]EHX6290426.1 hypothetical protein [Salmonella enterica subsp. enterica serovar Larochelle]